MLSAKRWPLYDFRGAYSSNYLIKEDKAYTEDGLLILNIFFCSKKMTKKEVYDYFIYFGEVKSVYLLSFPWKTRGFVKFANASSAAKALQADNYAQREHPVYVKASDSWKQPNGSKQCSPDDCYTSANPSCSADYRHLNILRLPDYCLEEVCHNLNLSERIHFARVCARFHEVFQMHSKRVYKIFDCREMNSMTKFEATYFIRYVGVHIETLKFRCGYLPKIIEKFIGRFCVNVKRLNLGDSKLSRPQLGKLLKNMKTLKELDLGYVRNLRGADIEVLCQIPSLKIIHLSGIPVAGEIITHMTQLEGLTLCRCSELTISDLADILKSLSSLKMLDIREVFPQIDYPRVLNAITDYGKELVELKVDYDYRISYASLAQLPNLERLQLYQDYFTLDEPDGTQLLTLLEDLVSYRSNQLEGLKIPHINLAKECCEAISQLKELKQLDLSDCDTVSDDALGKLCNLKKLRKIAVGSLNLTNKGVLELLYNCKDLRYINMTKCFEINNDFIIMAIKILEGRRDTFRKPVVFHVFGTSVSEEELSNMSDYKAAEEAGLLMVDFDPMYIDYDFTMDLDDV